MARHALEVATSLGDTLLELVVIDQAMQLDDLEAVRTADGFALRHGGCEIELRRGETVNLKRGRGSIVATVVDRAVHELPRPRVDRRAAAFLVASLALHVGVLVAAYRHREEAPAPPGRIARLISKHATAPTAVAAKTSVASVDLEDSAAGRAQPAAMAVSDDGGEAPPEQVAGASGADELTKRVAQDPDPCVGGDCGLIASGPYTTRSTGEHAGADYDLAPRKPHELDLSVVACTVDGGCNTTSGHDQQDIRAGIAQHVGELHDCFSRGTSPAASIELTIDDAGTVHAAAREGDPIGGCLAGVVGQLAFAGGAREVTLAFARD